MCEQIQVNLPQCFELNELYPLDTIMHPNSNKVGFLIAGEHFHKNAISNPIVRVYLMNLQENGYEVTTELESFKFSTIHEAQSFVAQLPTLSALDLILMLNKKQPAFV